MHWTLRFTSKSENNFNRIVPISMTSINFPESINQVLILECVSSNEFGQKGINKYRVLLQ